MEQYLGQFLGNLLENVQGGNYSSTFFSGFIFLLAFTVLSYLLFRILFIALKIGALVGAIAIVISMGMPNVENQGVSEPKNQPSALRENSILIPNLSNYFSEEKLREEFLALILGVKSNKDKT
jgi:hypothetical protein